MSFTSMPPPVPRAEAPLPADLEQDGFPERARQILCNLSVTLPGLEVAVVAMVDGREVASVRAGGQHVVAPRMAAICSSLLALAESFGQEALHSRTLHTTATTEHGSIVLVRVPARSGNVLLCVCANASENLAMTLRFALDAAQSLAVAHDRDA